MTTTVKFLSLTSFTAWQVAKAEEARRLIELTVNSARFQEGILEAKFLDTRLEKPDGTVVSNLTTRQILGTILTGTERGSAPDHVIGLRVTLYHKRWSSAIGYLDDDGVIHTRSKPFNNLEPIEIAGHWLHEWTHAAGFRHDYDRTSRRDRSVPYLVGELLIEHAAPFTGP